MRVVSHLVEGPLDAERELGALIADAAGDGAVVSFVGLARPTDAAGAKVEQLTLHHHATLTDQSLQRIADDCAARFPVSHVRVAHRSGRISPGTAIVFAGAAAPHRRAAFDAADYLMDRLKTEAMLWKAEVGAGGSRWIEPTDDDRARRDRWG